MRVVAAQLAKYAVLGGLGAAVDYAVFGIVVSWGAHYLPGNCLSVSCGITTSFLLNSRFTFARTDHRARRLFRFFVIGLSGLLCSTVLLGLLVLGGTAPLVAKLVIMPLVALSQFATNRQWTFRACVRCSTDDAAHTLV